ncbi:RES family NAD+ phosphorylase [Kordia jejudonensis]|uniref:RES family NAD+ phosphorylase n=1 Tax=Kordia jejudonensis TaxID=1348245 RepID=UPI0006292225|nr:RES family NAD+ phosphorylase [Kordia jejudonensis]
MIVYRVCGSKYANDISGESSKRQRSNRWNSFGTPMLYTSDSPALCAVEIHQYLPPSFIPKNYSLLQIEVPDVEHLLVEDTFFKDEQWIDQLLVTQKFGDFFIEKNEHLVMKVPSAMISSCFNYLINPMHKDFNKVIITNTKTFPMEGKLFKK